MPTTVHIPNEILDAVDTRAKALKVSRNRFIVQALRRALAKTDAWSDGFLDALDRLTPLDSEVDEMLEGVRQHRRSKKPPAL